MKVLLYEITIAAKSQNLVIGLDEKHMPDADWMTKVLATLNFEHRFFAKDYMPRRLLKNQEEEDEYIDDEEGFFFGLDNVQSKSKSKR